MQNIILCDTLKSIFSLFLDVYNSVCSLLFPNNPLSQNCWIYTAINVCTNKMVSAGFYLLSL